MKISIIISVFFLLSSCSEGQRSKIPAEKINFFDSVQQQEIKLLDSLHLTQFNDTSKWLLYTIQCDDSSKFGRVRDRKILPKIPLGFLRLNLNYVVKQSDTLSLLYNFLYDDSTTVEQSTGEKTIIGGLQFDTKKNKIIGYIVGEAVYNQSAEPSSRYKSPLQPEVIAFIKNNKDKLDPWFREEAKRRKIIE